MLHTVGRMSDQTLPARAVELLRAPHFATVATLNPDGSPQLSIVWVTTDGDDVVFSTIEGRRKTLNMERDPRVSLIVCPPDAPYTYAEVRGTATMTTEGGRELIDRFAREYTGAERYTADDGTDNVRVVVRVRPAKVIVRG